MELEKETALVETILFLESEPATEKALSNISRLSEEVVRQCIEKLKEKYLAENSGIELTARTLRRKEQRQAFAFCDGNSFHYCILPTGYARRN